MFLSHYLPRILRSNFPTFVKRTPPDYTHNAAVPLPGPGSCLRQRRLRYHRGLFFLSRVGIHTLLRTYRSHQRMSFLCPCKICQCTCRARSQGRLPCLLTMIQCLHYLQWHVYVGPPVSNIRACSRTHLQEALHCESRYLAQQMCHQVACWYERRYE